MIIPSVFKTADGELGYLREIYCELNEYNTFVLFYKGKNFDLSGGIYLDALKSLKISEYVNIPLNAHVESLTVYGIRDLRHIVDDIYEFWYYVQTGKNSVHRVDIKGDLKVIEETLNQVFPRRAEEIKVLVAELQQIKQVKEAALVAGIFSEEDISERIYPEKDVLEYFK